MNKKVELDILQLDGQRTKNELLKFYTAHCILDDDAYDDLEFALEYLTNPDMRRVFAEHDAEPRENYSDTLDWDEE